MTWLRWLLELVPKAARAVGSLVRELRQPQIAYSRDAGGQWIARYKGHEATGPTRAEAARRVLFAVASAERGQ